MSYNVEFDDMDAGRAMLFLVGASQLERPVAICGKSVQLADLDSIGTGKYRCLRARAVEYLVAIPALRKLCYRLLSEFPRI